MSLSHCSDCHVPTRIVNRQRCGRCEVGHMLRAQRSVTTGEFLTACLPRFSARIKELRQRGWEIRSERVRDGQWRFTYVSHPSSTSGVASAAHAALTPARVDLPRQASPRAPESLFDPPPAGAAHWQDAA